MENKKTTKADVMCFEKYYSDNSGIQYAVQYDRKPYLHDESIIGFITIGNGGDDDVLIPITQLDWLLETLQRIKAEI